MNGGVSRNTILIVEDDDDIRDALEELLQLNGYATTSAASGETALELLRSNPLPKLILLDLMMPGMDGREFRKHQLADASIASIPVVVVTAGSASLARDLDPESIVKKPFTPDALLDAIRLALPTG